MDAEVGEPESVSDSDVIEAPMPTVDTYTSTGQALRGFFALSGQVRASALDYGTMSIAASRCQGSHTHGRVGEGLVRR